VAVARARTGEDSTDTTLYLGRVELRLGKGGHLDELDVAVTEPAVARRFARGLLPGLLPEFPSFDIRMAARGGTG
jgi:hypothetical protein